MALEQAMVVVDWSDGTSSRWSSVWTDDGLLRDEVVVHDILFQVQQRAQQDIGVKRAIVDDGHCSCALNIDQDKGVCYTASKPCPSLY